MRIRRQPAPLSQLLPEVFQMTRIQPALKKGPRVIAGRGVPLEVDQVSQGGTAAPSEKGIKADLVQRGAGGECGNMPANSAAVPVGVSPRRHRVPANVTLDPPLDLTVTGIGWLFLNRNGVDV